METNFEKELMEQYKEKYNIDPYTLIADYILEYKISLIDREKYNICGVPARRWPLKAITKIRRVFTDYAICAMAYEIGAEKGKIPEEEYDNWLKEHPIFTKTDCKVLVQSACSLHIALIGVNPKRNRRD